MTRIKWKSLRESLSSYLVEDKLETLKHWRMMRGMAWAQVPTSLSQGSFLDSLAQIVLVIIIFLIFKFHTYFLKPRYVHSSTIISFIIITVSENGKPNMFLRVPNAQHVAPWDSGAINQYPRYSHSFQNYHVLEVLLTISTLHNLNS